MKIPKILSPFLSFVLMQLLTLNAFAWDGEPSWTTMSRDDITAIANEMIDSTWSPANDIDNFGYYDNNVTIRHQFSSDTTYTGEAYSQCYPQQDWDEFEADVNSTTEGETAYGNDCSGFVSMSWKLLDRYNTTGFSQNLDGTYFYALGATASAKSVNLLQGDALNDAGSHIVLFDSYLVEGIKTMEQTPWNAVRINRSYSWLEGYRPIRRNSLQDTFQVNDSIKTTANLNVRSCASTSCNVLATQQIGSIGTIVGAAQDADDYRWWQVEFSQELTGWCVEGYLKINSLLHDITPPASTSVVQGEILEPIDIEHTNNTELTVEYTVQPYLTFPNGDIKTFPESSAKYLKAGQTKTPQRYLYVPEAAQTGTHILGIKITYTDSSDVDDDSFEFTVISQTAQAHERPMRAINDRTAAEDIHGWKLVERKRY